MAKAHPHTAQGAKVESNTSPGSEADVPISPQAFEELFRKYYEELFRFSLRYVKQQEIAEEIVQDVFVKLWQKAQQKGLPSSIKAYLYAAVRNSSVNYLKSQFARQQFEAPDASYRQLQTDSTRETLDVQELKELVAEAVERLPQQCRTIFELSRSAGLTYQEIAKELNISPKTVENQMGIALKKMKEYLRTYWDLLIVILVILSQNYGNF